MLYYFIEEFICNFFCVASFSQTATILNFVPVYFSLKFHHGRLKYHWSKWSIWHPEVDNEERNEVCIFVPVLFIKEGHSYCILHFFFIRLHWPCEELFTMYSLNCTYNWLNCIFQWEITGQWFNMIPLLCWEIHLITNMIIINLEFIVWSDMFRLTPSLTQYCTVARSMQFYNGC